jgi:hypothetical protein
MNTEPGRLATDAAEQDRIVGELSAIPAYDLGRHERVIVHGLAYLVANTPPADPAAEAAQIVETWRQFMVQKLNLDGALKFHQVVNVVVTELLAHRSVPAPPGEITGATIIRDGVHHVVPDVEPERSATGARSQWGFTRLWHNAPDGHPIALACPVDGGDGLGWQFMTAAGARDVATELLSAVARAEAGQAASMGDQRDNTPAYPEYNPDSDTPDDLVDAGDQGC